MDMKGTCLSLRQNRGSATGVVVVESIPLSSAVHVPAIHQPIELQPLQWTVTSESFYLSSALEF